MTDVTPQAGASAGDLQFDRAVYDQAAGAPLKCAGCGAVLANSYYEVNGQTTCARCREQIERHMAGSAGPSGVLIALAAGTAVAVGCALLYFAILKLTGYEFGLIAVLVGFAVGRVVRWASHDRGGAIYQTIAVLLTYLSIVGAAVPILLSQANSEWFSSGAAMVALLVLLLISPFMGGVSNLLGLLILGFGLFEAWRVNKRVPVQVTGPYHLRKDAPLAGQAPTAL